MTLTELKYIVAVARERHFGKAAEACFISQPTLSVAVKKLEEELDVKLFERIGNKEGIVKVVDSFVQNVDADKRVNKLFAKTKADKKRMERFKQMLVEQICELSGGPCKYAGKDMKAAHKGMKITDAQFDAIVDADPLAEYEAGRVMLRCTAWPLTTRDET